MFGLRLAALLSARARRRRPSVRVGVPWAGALLAWVGMARVAVDGRAFDGGWGYWLSVGGVVIPLAVVLSSLIADVWPTWRSVGACVLASEAGTVASIVLLHVSREPFPFAVLGGFFVAFVAAAAYVVASSIGEVARRDAHDP